ncbi:hypothetical protein FDP41_011014 [Naegleria fowleri]|uniref:RGS domain-containing protein n=1 Tax=Naegleria fowleri TaxID=5763 RepID=A0A6A5C5K1_NAEFO|nr:uncharacterized protein FDP41_011014 [Naegleria fowleri]KAF0983036.1 hypothetical protein FDP41_011014 [Naegleria fowleri]
MATTLTRTISQKRITSVTASAFNTSCSDPDDQRLKSPRLSTITTTMSSSTPTTLVDPASDSVVSGDHNLTSLSIKYHADLDRFYEDFRCFLMGDDEDGLFSSSNNSPKSSRDTAGMSPLSPRRSISSSANTILKKKKKQLVDFTEICIRKRNISSEFLIDLAVKFHQQIIPKDNRHLLKSFKDSFTGREAVTLVCQLINAERIVNSHEALQGISSQEEVRLLSQSLCHLMLHFRFIFHMTHKKHFKDSGYSFYGLCKNLKKAQTDFVSNFSISPKKNTSNEQQATSISSTATSIAPLTKRKSFCLGLTLNLKKLQENTKESNTSTVDSDDEDCCGGVIDTSNVQPFVHSKNTSLTHSNRSSVSSSTDTPKTPTGSFSSKKNKRNTLMIPKLNLNHILHLNHNNNNNHDPTCDDPKSEVIEISKPFDLEFSILQRKENIPASSNSTTDSSDEENHNDDHSCTKGISTTKRPSPQKTSSADMTAVPLNTRSRRSSLSQLLSDNYMREQFKLYSRDELSSENVIFYEEVLKFLNSLFLSEEEQRKVAVNLYELFIPATSLYQLNLPSKLILKFNKEYETNFANTANVVLLFKEALTETEHSMHDTYKRFQFTKEYQQYKLRKLLHEKDERSDGFNTSRY